MLSALILDILSVTHVSASSSSTCHDSAEGSDDAIELLHLRLSVAKDTRAVVVELGTRGPLQLEAWHALKSSDVWRTAELVNYDWNRPISCHAHFRPHAYQDYSVLTVPVRGCGPMLGALLHMVTAQCLQIVGLRTAHVAHVAPHHVVTDEQKEGGAMCMCIAVAGKHAVPRVQQLLGPEDCKLARTTDPGEADVALLLLLLLLLIRSMQTRFVLGLGRMGAWL